MKPDEAELLKLAEDGVSAANLLMQNGYYAFAASRAYYAMFAAAEAVLLTKELSFSKHSAVISAFGREFAKTGLVPVRLHRALIVAQEDRQAADYGGGKQVTPEEAEQHILNAEDFVQCATAYLAEQADGKP